MRSGQKIQLAVSFVILLFASIILADILVCAQCGYENPENAEVCSHCNAKLPPHENGKQSEVASINKKALPPGKVEFIDGSVVEDEIKMAGQNLKNNEFELANLFARNAAALEMLTDPKDKADRSERIVELRKKSETGGMKVSRKCAKCNGTGKYFMDATALDGKTTTIEVAGRSCTDCGGSGNVFKPSTIDERRYKLGRAMNRYTALQQSRKFIPLGEAWIPAGLDGKLAVRQSAMLKRAVALSCADCVGLGRIDCAKCKGMGEIKCTVQGCVNGKIETKEEGKLVKGIQKKTVVCRTCNGTALISCPDCRGKGSSLCKKCNGSGERAICAKCGGQGLVPCRRCQGSGSVKDTVCAECRGEGVGECSACSGDGRKK